MQMRKTFYTSFCKKIISLIDTLVQYKCLIPFPSVCVEMWSNINWGGRKSNLDKLKKAIFISIECTHLIFNLEDFKVDFSNLL